MNSLKSWGLEVDPDIFKILKKMPRRDAEVVLNIIKLLPTDPYFGDIQKMKGEQDAWRRRVGHHRIFYKIKTKERVVLVFTRPFPNVLGHSCKIRVYEMEKYLGVGTR